MKEVLLYGADGRPIERQALTTEIAAPSLTGVRNVWRQAIGGDLTPGRLAALLRGAAENDGDDYLTLAEEMEERDPHYASVLGVRKRAVSGLATAVESASDDADDVKRADAVRELVRRPEFGTLVEDLLDGLGKGFSACEIMWDRTGATWWPQAYVWRDPRFFRFDQETGQELRIKDDSDTMFGIPIPPYKFVVHMPRLKTGLPLRGGLARLVAVAYMCKSYSVTDWLSFAEVFGMPLRLGRYGANPSADDLRVLKSAVANLATDAAAILPDSMKIEFIERGAVGGEGSALFQNLAGFLDRQVSKAVLGQTASSEGTPGKLGGDDAQADVRDDIQRADAQTLGHTICRDLVRPFIDLNFGPQAAYPRVAFPVPEPEDIPAFAEALAKLVPLGLRVEASVVRDRLNVPDPPKGTDVELLQPQSPAPLPGADAAINALSRQIWRAAAPRWALDGAAGVFARSANQAGAMAAAPADDVDALVTEALQGWEPMMAPVVDPIQALLNRCSSYDEFLSGLPALLQTMAPADLMGALAQAAFKARGLGDASDPA